MKEKKTKQPKDQVNFSTTVGLGRQCLTKAMGLLDPGNLLLGDLGLSFLQFIVTFPKQ